MQHAYTDPQKVSPFVKSCRDAFTRPEERRPYTCPRPLDVYIRDVGSEFSAGIVVSVVENQYGTWSAEIFLGSPSMGQAHRITSGDFWQEASDWHPLEVDASLRGDVKDLRGSVEMLTVLVEQLQERVAPLLAAAADIEETERPRRGRAAAVAAG